MFRLPFCQFVLGLRLLVTALHFRKFHCLHRNLTKIIRRISLPDKHIFQFEFSFQQSVFRLGEFLLQTEFIQFSQFLSFMYTVAILHVNTGNDFTRFKTQIGFTAGIHLSVAYQFVVKIPLLQNLSGYLIFCIRKNGGYS